NGVHPGGGDTTTATMRNQDRSTRSLGGALMAFGANMTKREQSLIGIGVAAVLLLGAYWYFLYRPKSAEIAVTQAHVDSLDKKNQQAKADIAQGSLQKLRAQSAEYD